MTDGELEIPDLVSDRVECPSADFENMARKVQDYAGMQQQSESIQDMVFQLGNVCEQACDELKTEFNRIKMTTNEKK